MNPSQALHVAWYKTFFPNCHGDHSLKRSGGSKKCRRGGSCTFPLWKQHTLGLVSSVWTETHTSQETNLRNWKSMHVCSPGAWWDSSCECCAAVDVYRLSREDGLRRWGSRVVLSAKDWFISSNQRTGALLWDGWWTAEIRASTGKNQTNLENHVILVCCRPPS